MACISVKQLRTRVTEICQKGAFRGGGLRRALVQTQPWVVVRNPVGSRDEVRHLCPVPELLVWLP